MSEKLIEQLKFEEGFRARKYLCTRGHWTIGYGRNLDARPYFEGAKIPAEITQEKAEAILASDVWKTTEALHACWHGFGLLQGARKDACVQMAFQMGVDGFLGFKKMRDALVRCDWQAAYNHALDSKWAREDSPARAKRVAGQFLTGEHHEVPA